MKTFKSGETAPKSGKYKIVGSRGAVHGTVSIKKGETLPPTQSPNQHYEMG